jgi:hypothetical protein
MSILQHIKRKCMGVGDFDTSDLPMGSRPTNDAYYRDPPVELLGEKYDKSVWTSKTTGERVESLRDVPARNGYRVTINRYGGNNEKVQVFIDHIQRDTSICETVSMNELNDFIARNTE